MIGQLKTAKSDAKIGVSKMDQAMLAKELAKAVISLQLDNVNRRVGFSVLSNEEVTGHYQTLIKHVTMVVKVSGDQLKPEFHDVSNQIRQLEEIFMSITLGEHWDEDDLENNSRIASEFMTLTLNKMFS